MASPHALGRLGETLARLYLEYHGWTCAAAGYRRPGGEIDLVMTRENWVIFVEVKTRGPRSLARPEEWVTPLKLARLRLAARHWLAEVKPQGPRNFRFDVIAIEDNGQGCGLTMRHLANVC